MKSALEHRLTQRWYGAQAPGFGSRLLAGTYHAALKLRAGLYASGLMKTQRIDAPVIVVGNFTAGGTGKTPLIVALALRLQARGWRPGIVSRGYGRTSKGQIVVEADTPPDRCGDEPKLIFERTQCPVFVDSDRVAAARRAIASGCNLILSDDGLQHRRLARDIEIEVLDGERRYGNGLLMPAGPLREPPRDTGLRVINGGQAQAGEWGMSLHPGRAIALADGRRRELSEFAADGALHALAGIGHPERFFAALRAQGLEPIEHPFPDHHAYRAEDFAGMTGTILMTEKDAVKCRGLGLEKGWYVPVEAELDEEFYDRIIERLENVAP